MIELKEITPANYEEVLNLKVAEHQKSYVSTVAYSLAQAWVYKTAYPFAIYENEKVVGFIMLGFYQARKQYTLWKFLIDERYQNKGYGRKALQLAIDYLINTFDVTEIFTGVSLANETAKHLYTSIGFVATGVVEDNMEEMKYIRGK